MQQQWEWVGKELSMPEELVQSVVYLQRALRDYVMQHQVLASKINILAMRQRPKVKQCMLELEREILSIGLEQEGVVRQLSERVKRFQMMAQSNRNVSVPEDIVCGYVSRLLVVQGDSNDTAPTAVPKHISPRWSAADLAEKFSLETLLEHDATVAPENDLEAGRDLIHTDNAQWDTALSIAKKKSKQAVTKTYTKSFVTAQSGSRSGAKANAEDRPFAGIADQKLAFEKQETKPEEVDAEDEEEDDEEDQDQTPEKSSEDEPDREQKPTIAKTVPSRGAWVPKLRGRPPKGTKYVSATKQSTVIASRRLSVVQLPLPAPIVARRASKRKDVLSEKVEDPVEMEESAGEEESPPTELLNSAAVRRGRSNLLQALNKQKRGPGRPSLDSMSVSVGQKVAKRAGGPVPGGSKLVKHASYASSGSSPNSRSSTPTWGARNPSEDSSDRRSSPASEFPPLPDTGPDPIEPPQPSSISEMDQATFLRYFRVYPPEEVKAMKERKSERKRRSCYSTERKDFHYGKLDYYEQQQQFQAARATTNTATSNKRTHQRPILYSPPVAVAKRRKNPPSLVVSAPPPPPPPAPSARQQSAGTGATVRSSSSSSFARPRIQPANIFAAMDKRACFVCSKSGTTDELGACMNCCNIYHLSCHTVDEQSEAYRHRDDLCPVCLPETENGESELGD